MTEQKKSEQTESGRMENGLGKTETKSRSEELEALYPVIRGFIKDTVMVEVQRQLLAKDALTPLGEKKQKHEEIKRMAWDVICNTWRKKAFSKKQYATSCNEAWRIAELFYNYAKEKEAEGNDSTRN